MAQRSYKASSTTSFVVDHEHLLLGSSSLDILQESRAVNCLDVCVGWIENKYCCSEGVMCAEREEQVDEREKGERGHTINLGGRGVLGISVLELVVSHNLLEEGVTVNLLQGDT